MWFLAKLENLANMEKDFDKVKRGEREFDLEFYKAAKNYGYPDKVIEQLTGKKIVGSQGILSEAKEAAKLLKKGEVAHMPASYKMVDTCAGEFNAETPYFYGCYDEENEAEEFLEELKAKNSNGEIKEAANVLARLAKGSSSEELKEAADKVIALSKEKKSKGTIIVLGSGPIRIGQGIEFDYASVQCV